MMTVDVLSWNLAGDLENGVLSAVMGMDGLELCSLHLAETFVNPAKPLVLHCFPVNSNLFVGINFCSNT